MFDKLFLVFFMLITVEWMMRIQFIERTNEKKPLNSHDTHRYHSFKIFFVYFCCCCFTFKLIQKKKIFFHFKFHHQFFFIAGTFVPMMITLFNYYQEINIHNCSISFLFLFFLLKIKLHHHNDDDNNNDGSMEPKITATAAINDWKNLKLFFHFIQFQFLYFFFKCYSNIFKKNLWCVNLVFFCFIFFLLQIQLKFLWKNFFFLCKYHLCVCLWQCVIVSFMQQFIRNNRFLIKGGCHG